MKHITDNLVIFCTQKPKTVYVILAIIALFFCAQIPRIQIDTDPENMLDAAHPARVFHNDIKTRFAMHDAIVVGVVNNTDEAGVFTPETLTDIYDITASILSIDGVIATDLMSISTVDNITQSQPGTIRFEWMMPKPPQDAATSAQIQRNLARLPLLQDTLASQNGKAAAIYVPIKDKNESYNIAEQIRAKINQLDGTSDWYITGLPVAEDQFGYEMFIQMGIAAPLAGLTIFVLLFLFFRNIPLIIAPMIVAMSTVLITMGALIGLGYTVHIMSSMIAIFLMPIAVVDSVHILSEFSDRHKPGESLNDTIEEVIGHLFTPMLYTSITSSVGFYSLMLTPIPPVQVFGAFVGTGIILAFVITITFMPAYLSRMTDASLDKLQAVMHSQHGGSRIAQLAKGLGSVALRFKGLLVFGFAAVFAVSVWGISQIQINDNPVRWFKPDHEIRVADTVLNANFAGTYDAYIVLSAADSLMPLAELLNADRPESLNIWAQQQISQLASQPRNEQYQTLIINIEDALFSDVNPAEEVYFNTLLSTTENALSQSKAFQSPALLSYIEQLQAHLQASGLVGKSNSLTDVTKVVNRELRSGNDADYQIPESPQAVAQTLLQYQSSHRPDDLWHFVTPDFQQTLIWLQLASGDNQDMSQVIELVNEYVTQHPLPQNIDLNWAGKAYINVIWQENMVAGMLDSLMSAFVIVFIMMVLLFRSLVFGVLAMLPLTITITFIYGLIGIIGKDYDMPIAVLSALTLGLSVDFAIHFLERIREVYKQTQDLQATFTAMFDEPATAITRNALVIALGFTPLLFAPLVPYITVGIFLASIMAISALVTLLILPAVMTMARGIVFKPNEGVGHEKI
ncbi:MAG: MMPL family transporter [Glaciecola sp.]|nr:MMPL family transporter [Glaciecola sp.]MDG1817061.1 MMPL family transporter [Glaciecola sp.]MDG2099802.1 MMPL family transporter [Glaciecola sp.]